ncbi:MAG TPA: hypothetical protein VNV38_16755 [Stellaceae bacterium]|nr:hypothetical protein [Stellaceae bacterium]
MRIKNKPVALISVGGFELVVVWLLIKSLMTGDIAFVKWHAMDPVIGSHRFDPQLTAEHTQIYSSAAAPIAFWASILLLGAVAAGFGWLLVKVIRA